MKKKELAEQVAILENDLEITSASQKYYQDSYYDVLDELDELEARIETEYKRGYDTGYAEGWDASRELSMYAHRPRVWYKLWL